MFDKTGITMWEINNITYLISINDDGTLFLTERKQEVMK